jgi:hypothetical protein
VEEKAIHLAGMPQTTGSSPKASRTTTGPAERQRKCPSRGDLTKYRQQDTCTRPVGTVPERRAGAHLQCDLQVHRAGKLQTAATANKGVVSLQLTNSRS